MVEIILTIRDVLPWFKELVPSIDKVYNSFVDLSEDVCAGIYARRHGLVQPEAMGGQASYGITSLTILVRAGTNSGDAQELAHGIWRALRATSGNETIGSTTAWIRARKEPVFIERDERNVFTYVVDFEIYYRK